MSAELRGCVYAARRTLQAEEAGKNRFVLLISTDLPSIGVAFIALIMFIIAQVATYKILGVQPLFFLERGLFFAGVL